MNRHIASYEGRGFKWKLAAALGAVYILWGSTYFAIRVAVSTIPPLLAAGVRFVIAGLLLYGWSRLRGKEPPQRSQWLSLWLMGLLMFLVCYGLLFWAEKTVPSGVTSVLVAMIPAWMLILEVMILKTQRLSKTVVAALMIGLAGVAILTGALDSAGRHIPWLPFVAILLSGISWSLGSVVSKKMNLPVAQGINAGGQMMCGGCLLLLCSGLFGEWHGLRPVPQNAIFSMIYLIVAGSLIAYSAYVWLLRWVPSSKASSYAYVNPVVALGVGYFMGGEALHASAVVGAVLALISVFIILTHRTSVPVETRRENYTDKSGS